MKTNLAYPLRGQFATMTAGARACPAAPASGRWAAGRAPALRRHACPRERAVAAAEHGQVP